MNHLIHVQSPFRVPYLCRALPPCRSSTFMIYPETCDINIGRMRNGDLQGKSEEEVAAFLQAWLFFGVMDAHFNLWGIPVEVDDFRQTDEDTASNREWITLEPNLKLLLMYLTARTTETELLENDDLRVRIWTEHKSMYAFVSSLLNDIIVWRRSLFPSGPHNKLDIPDFDSIVLCIMITLEYLANSSLKIYANGEQPVSLHWKLDNASQYLLLYAGWCPGEISFLYQRLEHATSLYLISSFDRHGLRKDHSKCTRQTCQANQLDAHTYKTRHTTEGCICEHIIEQNGGKSQVVEILNSGEIPIIKVVENAAKNFDIVVERSRCNSDGKPRPYVALSHVWSDGLGNPHNNSLPRCQLRRLQSFVNELYDESLRPVFFWIDTICVPLERESRNQAIRRMGKTYQEADNVLVLDSWLMRSPCNEYGELNMLQVKCCTWTQRLWTLQECMIARAGALYFRTAKGNVHTRDMYEPERLGVKEVIESIIGTQKDALKAVFEKEADLLLRLATLLGTNDLDDVSFGKDGLIDSKLRRLSIGLRGWTMSSFIRTEGSRFFHNLHHPRTRYDRSGHRTASRPYLVTNDLILIGYSMRNRSTSRLEDEPVCLATLLGQDVGAILDESDVRERMKIVVSRLGLAAKDILFFHAQRIDEDGFRWAPASFLAHGREYSPATVVHPSSVGTVTPAGLKLKLDALAVKEVATAQFLRPAGFVIKLEDSSVRVTVPASGTMAADSETCRFGEDFVVLLYNSRARMAASVARNDAVLVRAKNVENGVRATKFVGNLVATLLQQEEILADDLIIPGRVIKSKEWCIG